MSEPLTNYDSADRAGVMRAVEAAVRRLLGAGISTVARFKTSIRVGSGAAALALFDGADGVITADGTAAGFFGRDRANSAQWFALYESGTVRLNLNGADFWLIDGTTAILGLKTAWTKVAGGVGFTNSWTDFDATETTYHQAAYCQDFLGFVHLRGLIKSGTIATTAFTLPAGLGPLKQKLYIVDDGANTGQVLEITAAGGVLPLTGNNAFFSLEGVTFDTR